MARFELGSRLLWGFALLLASNAAFAERPGKAAAETLFDRGRALLAEQRTAEACAKFEASQELDAGVGTLLYLGECYERLGRTASAWATFKEAISLAQIRSDEREQLASIRAAALEPRLTRVILRVREIDRIPGLTIGVGRASIPRASWGVALPVDPGRRRVEASAPGHETWTRSIEFPGRGNAVVEVPRLHEKRRFAAEWSISPAEAPSRGIEPDRAQAGSAQRTVGLVLGGLGVVGLAGATVLAVKAKRKDDASLEHCPRDQSLCSPEGKALRDQALGYAHASTAVFAAAGALVVAGVVVHVSAPSQPHAAARSLSVGAALGGKSGELSLSGAF